MLHVETIEAIRAGRVVMLSKADVLAHLTDANRNRYVPRVFVRKVMDDDATATLMTTLLVDDGATRRCSLLVGVHGKPEPVAFTVDVTPEEWDRFVAQSIAALDRHEKENA